MENVQLLKDKLAQKRNRLAAEEIRISAPRKVRKNQLVRIQPMQSLTNSIEATIALQEVTSVMKPIGATY